MLGGANNRHKRQRILMLERDEHDYRRVKNIKRLYMADVVITPIRDKPFEFIVSKCRRSVGFIKRYINIHIRPTFPSIKLDNSDITVVRIVLESKEDRLKYTLMM